MSISSLLALSCLLLDRILSVDRKKNIVVAGLLFLFMDQAVIRSLALYHNNNNDNSGFLYRSCLSDLTLLLGPVS